MQKLQHDYHLNHNYNFQFGLNIGFNTSSNICSNTGFNTSSNTRSNTGFNTSSNTRSNTGFNIGFNIGCKFLSLLLIAIILSAGNSKSTNAAETQNSSQHNPSAQSAAIPDWNDIDKSTTITNTPTSVRLMDRTDEQTHIKPLVGRVEQLSREASPAPPDEQFKDVTDPKDEKTARQVETFPKSFVGKWNGKVTIDQIAYGVLKIRDPKMYTRESNIMYKGRTGIGQVFFELIGDTVEALSPVADFIPQPRDRKYMDLVKGHISPGAHFNVRFRDRTNRTTITGTEASYRVTIDRITELDNKVYEEQIATISNVIDPIKHAASYGTAETVLQFHLLDNMHMEVRMVSVHYASDHAMESKLFIHGIFQRRQI